MKKILCFFIGAAMLGSTVCAKIDETTIMGGTTFEYTEKVTPNARVSITVLKPFKTAEDFEAASDKLSVLAGYRETTADADGNFGVNFNFGAESGEYRVILGVEGHAEPVKKTLHYVNTDKNAIAVATLKTALAQDAAAVKTVIANSGSDLGMDTNLFSEADEEDIRTAAEILLEDPDRIDVSDNKALSAALDKALAIALLNNGEIEVFGDYQNTFLADNDIKKWCEKSFVDDETKAYMNSKMSKSSESFEEFDKALAEAVALGIIRDADGYGSITSYLKEYADVLEIEEKYVTSAFAKSIIGDEFDSLEDTDMESFVADTTTSGNSGGGGGSLGGISVQGGSFAPATPLPKNEETNLTSAFKDLANYGWAEASINELYELGIINGRATGVFAPGETVLREEFVKMILEAGKFGEIIGSIEFADVPQDAWFYEYVRNAFACGIINGVSETNFGSGREISRQDMAVVCYNMLNNKGVITADSIAATGKVMFADKSQIADYAVSATEYLSNAGILKGDENGKFNPFASLTRAEAAVVICRINSLIENAGL